MSILFLVDYTRGEVPRCLLTAAYDNKAVSPLIAVSNSAHVIAIAVGNCIQLFSGVTGELDEVIESVFNDHIMAIAFDFTGLKLFAAGDRQVRVFHNVTAYKVGGVAAREKLKEARITSATQERLEKQIEEYEEFIEQFDDEN
jgi:hypothetical protein